jgi:hypothetical protein
MKKQWAMFAAGLLLGGALVLLYLAAEGKFWNNPPLEIPTATVPAQPHPVDSSAGEPDAQSAVEPNKQPPAGAADTGARTDTNAPDIQSPDAITAQLIPEQYLPAKLQDALRQYPALKEKDDRASLVMDVLGMTDNGATKQEVAQVLGTMFHEEPTADLKLDLLDDLIMVGDNDAAPTFLEAIDPSQPKEVRTKAILGLENLDDSSRIAPYLQQLLTDPDPDVRQEAQDALDRLGSQ